MQKGASENLPRYGPASTSFAMRQRESAWLLPEATRRIERAAPLMEKETPRSSTRRSGVLRCVGVTLKIILPRARSNVHHTWRRDYYGEDRASVVWTVSTSKL